MTTSPGSRAPQWSPDGTRIAWRATFNFVSDVWIADADGSNRVNLTDNPDGDFAPDWQ